MKALPILLFAALAVPACSGSDEPDVPTTPSQASAPSTPAAPAADTAADVPMDLAAGKDYFKVTCTPCHGELGHGDGPASAALDPHPRNLSDAAWQATIDDDYLKKIIKFGGAAVGKSPAMPANPQLNGKEDVLNGLVAHVRSLAK